MRIKSLFRVGVVAFSILLLLNCSNKTDHVASNKIFYDLDLSKTGIKFKNQLTENDSLNYFTFPYMFQGGGVSVGDINNDGLVDLYFTGNQVSNKLFLNKGNLQFEDVTAAAGVSGDNRWYTGVTMGDINGDGYLDIYCSVGGKFGPKRNQLFLNNGDGTFTDEGEKYGIEDNGDSIQSTFFDYDNDGDLDLYVANYPITKFNAPTFFYKQMMKNIHDEKSDHLYRNDGETFTNVTKESGIENFGLTLGITAGDINNDGWADIYISNDFMSPDFMYINNQDGTFKEVLSEATSHSSFYGMGIDIADFNNDGNLDVYQVDMDPKLNRRKKANMSTMQPDQFWEIVKADFHYQYMQNCMQLNSGVFENGIPFFSDVSRITGTSSTDWSWGPLIADFDNDGLKDLFITNGSRREVNNNDYFDAIPDVKISKEMLLSWSLMIPSEKIDNFIFKNNGDLNFKQVNKEWGIKFEGFSNGAVYADLDNDGDLEIIINNIDDYASVFENKSSINKNFIKIRFEGSSKNKFGLGNRVYVKTDSLVQMQELTLSRGFQSSVAPEVHFGLDQIEKIDELEVVWTDGTSEVIKDVEVNQLLVLKQVNARLRPKETATTNKLFKTEKGDLFPKYKHVENEYDDFKHQVLLPHKMSSFGPALAVGDLNNDGLDDYFIGGSATFSSAIFVQTKNGFIQQKLDILNEDKASEDVGALIFDADNDGDNDLYVVSGGYEFSVNSLELQDRLYINNGEKGFSKASLPKMLSSGSKAYDVDFDKDGKQDLIVLGRQIPGNYPSPADCFLLKNISENGKVIFENVTDEHAKGFNKLGMATSAVITDFDNDEWLDIIIVGEWMPIKVFRNNQGNFEDVSEEMGFDKNTTGWWWSINQGDFDSDGDMDYIVGNNGLNYKYQATLDETFDVFAKDFDNNGKDDIVLSYYNEGKQYPVRGRGCSSQQIPGIKKKFKNYESFANATLVDVYTEKSLGAALHYQVNSFASIYLKNDNGKFVIQKLPNDAQISSINQILVEDFDHDGFLDAVIAGNLYMSEVETPRNDASYGLFLKGDNKGNFATKTAYESGFFNPGDVKGMSKINVKGENYIISAKNNDFVQFDKINE